jgi:hypothetical protein
MAMLKKRRLLRFCWPWVELGGGVNGIGQSVVEFWRALLDMHEVQVKLVRERYRLSVLQG